MSLHYSKSSKASNLVQSQSEPTWAGPSTIYLTFQHNFTSITPLPALLGQVECNHMDHNFILKETLLTCYFIRQFFPNYYI